jgi:hypothetical protein
VRTALPLIKANLSAIGQIEPGSVQMRVSGLGVVPANYDPKVWYGVIPGDAKVAREIVQRDYQR